MIDIDQLKNRWNGKEALVKRIFSLLDEPDHLFNECGKELGLLGEKEWVDLRGISVEGLELSHVYFSCLDLSYATFNNCQIIGVTLDLSKFVGANFTGVRFKRGGFIQCVFDSTSFKRSTFFDFLMAGHSYKDCYFSEVQMDDVNLCGCDLSTPELCDVVAVGRGVQIYNTKLSSKHRFGPNFKGIR